MLRLSTSSFVFTPTRPAPLAGYALRTAAFEKVDDDLEAVFLRVSDEEGGDVVLGSVDTLHLTARSLSDIQSALGALRTPVCLFATHTHNAPSLAPDLPLLGRHDSEWYRAFVSSCARTIAPLAEQPGESVTLRYGEEATDLNINRRRRAWVIDYPALVRHGRISIGWRIAHAPNKRGLVDRRVRALFFENPQGEVKAVVWSLAAHPAFFPAPLTVSGDFPGLIRAALRQHFGNDCAVVYLPGFAGSAIPNIPMRMPTTFNETAILLLPCYPTYRSFDEKGYRKWVGWVLSKLMRAYEIRSLEESGNRVSVRHASVPGIFGRKEAAPDSSVDLQISRVTLARGLDILACNGEMLCEWIPLLQHVSSGTVLFSGYLAGEALYVPTSDDLLAGGYEVTGFQRAFGLDGEFHPDISRLVVSAVERLFGSGQR